MAQKEVAISVKNIHKNFILPQHKNTSFKQVAINIVRNNNKVTQKVLDGVSFDIYKGEFFGIVGRNGSGKSTLLKLMAGVYAPTSGEIAVNGGLTPFIELGVGFNHELSGRDNVYLNGALLGYTRKQMDKIYDEIVAFAELEPFMDQKLKNYSSGMQVRLAFSIAIKAKNDILIFDEVLAVGDEAFQRKCMEVFKGYRRKKQTVVLVTHNMESVKDFCTRAVMLSNGKIGAIGSVEEVSEAYLKANITAGEAVEPIDEDDGKDSTLKITGVKSEYKVHDILAARLEWSDVKNVHKVGIAILGRDGEYVFGTNTGEMRLKGSYVDYELDLILGPGKYKVDTVSYDKNGEQLEYCREVARFTVREDFSSEVGGLVRMSYKYTIAK